MARTRRVLFLDGREVVVASLEGFARLRERERVPTEDLGRHLDLIRSRGSRSWGLRVGVGESGQRLERRCEKPVTRLLDHGWLRLDEVAAVRWIPGKGTKARSH